MPSLKKIKTHVLICKHRTCAGRGGKAAAKELKRAIRDEGLREQVLVTKVNCLDQCGRGPVLVVYPEGVWYGEVGAERAREIVERHLARGRDAGGKILRDLRARGGNV